MHMSDIVVVTGGAGFIGSNFVRHLLASSEARIVVFDKLTYAGNLESLAVRGRESSLSFRARGHRRSRPGRRALRCPSPFGDRQLRGRDARRSLHRRSSRVHRRKRGRHVRAPRRRCVSTIRSRATSGGGFRFLHVSTDEVYGSLGAAGAFSETTRVRAPLPLCSDEGRSGPSRRRVPRDLRSADAHDELLEQLRPVPVSRETHPARHR